LACLAAMLERNADQVTILDAENLEWSLGFLGVEVISAWNFADGLSVV